MFLYDTVLDITWLRDANANFPLKISWSHDDTWAATLLVGGFGGRRLPKMITNPDTTLSYVAEIIVRPTPDAITLAYAASGEPVAERVELERTPCAVGGFSTWYKCPGCRKRVVILLLRGKWFRCRHCHDVPYRCQSEDRCKRMLRAEAKLARRLLPDGGRPKRMRRVTHDQLCERITDLQTRRFDLIDELMERWEFALR